jgi:hypothetical protein
MRNLLVALVFSGFCTPAAMAIIIPPADIRPPETFDLTISDTYEYAVHLNNQSLLVTGGGADEIVAKDFSYVEVRDTWPLEIDVGGIYTLDIDDNCGLNYYGGETALLSTYDYGVAILQGGSIDYLASHQNVPHFGENIYPYIKMIVKEYEYVTSSKMLTGLWVDDSPFSIQLVDQSGYDPVIDNIAFTVIPEPATLLLFGLGGLLLRRKK